MNELDIAVFELREKMVALINESRLPVTITSMVVSEVNSALQQNYQQIFNEFLQAKQAQMFATKNEEIIETEEER